jgi:hypothetical protein
MTVMAVMEQEAVIARKHGDMMGIQRSAGAGRKGGEENFEDVKYPGGY